MEKADNQEKWKLYYQKTVDKPPHFTLLKAIDMILWDGNKFAIDLGCGSGRSTLWLIENGWSVLAVDKDQVPFDFFTDKLKGNTARANVEVHIAMFEDLNLIAYPKADLIYAGYSIPFCTSQHFQALWGKIVGQLKSGGIFAGQFFSNKHSWLSTKREITFHTRNEATSLLDHFSIEYFEEEETDGWDVENIPVHWHVFHVVARKKAG
ncbi:MAG: class I SAM-dependent methyltransferase [Candidatus Paracaedibacter sp.]